MKYVSEITKKAYNTEQECLDAEKAFKEAEAKALAEKEKKTAERSARAKEVEEAYKASIEANKRYNELVNQFIQDYGSFHMTYSNTSDLLNNVFDSVFKFF